MAPPLSCIMWDILISADLLAAVHKQSHSSRNQGSSWWLKLLPYFSPSLMILYFIGGNSEERLPQVYISGTHSWWSQYITWHVVFFEKQKKKWYLSLWPKIMLDDWIQIMKLQVSNYQLSQPHEQEYVQN